jgi:hypothetical protein
MKLFIFSLLLSFSALATPELARLNTHVEILKTYASFDLSCSEDSDCLALTAGHRPCGGASLYVVTSKKNSFLSEAKRTAKIFTQEQKAYNIANNRISHCGMLSVPRVVCEAKLCK